MEPSKESHEADTISAEVLVSEVDTLPHRLGFAETTELRSTHEQIVKAIRTGNNSERLLALNRYLDNAERLVDAKPDLDNERCRAQVGLILAQALIWRDADEPVKFLRNVLSAREYAENMGFEDVLLTLDYELDKAIDSGELLQARGEFDGAVNTYIELEKTDMVDNKRGLLNLRLAECYQAIIDEDRLQGAITAELRDRSMESALLYLVGHPDKAKAIAFFEILVT